MWLVSGWVVMVDVRKAGMCQVLGGGRGGEAALSIRVRRGQGGHRTLGHTGAGARVGGRGQEGGQKYRER